MKPDDRRGRARIRLNYKGIHEAPPQAVHRVPIRRMRLRIETMAFLLANGIEWVDQIPEMTRDQILSSTNASKLDISRMEMACERIGRPW